MSQYNGSVCDEFEETSQKYVPSMIHSRTIPYFIIQSDYFYDYQVMEQRLPVLNCMLRWPPPRGSSGRPFLLSA
jgi:hypothetical protein